jgi:hypothetical protein
MRGEKMATNLSKHLVLVLLILVLGACNAPAPNIVATATVTLVPTDLPAVPAPTWTATAEPPTATATRVIPTATFTPLPPTITYTPRPPTATATRTLPPITPTPVSIPPITSAEASFSKRPIKYFGSAPLAIKLDSNDGLYYYIQTDASFTAAQLRSYTNNADVIAMTNRGNGFFDAILPHSFVTRGYTAANANHNAIGYLDLFQGNAQQGQFNVWGNVIDAQVPKVTVQTVAPQVYKTPHLVNLVIPSLNRANPDVRVVTQQFYKFFGDNYDFLGVVFIPGRNENRYFGGTKNQVQGIGKAQFDQSRAFGSAGRLLGIIHYPIVDIFDMAEQGSLHELAHNWINALSGPKLPIMPSGLVHWPISSLATGIIGTQCCGGQGVMFPWRFTKLEGDAYRTTEDSVAPNSKYTDMELYLMGMLPADQVAPHFIFANQDQKLCDGCVLRGAVPFTVDQVIAAYGPRVPAYGQAQTKFRVAIVVASPTPLSQDEMMLLDYFAARGSLKTPVNFSSGFLKGIANPFYVATGGRGCLIMTIDADGGC